MENLQLEVKKQSFQPPQAYSNLVMAALAEQLRKHQTLLEIVRTVLPTVLSGRVTACVLSGRKLLLYTDSAHWASQLRFHSASILKAVNAAADASVDVVVTRIQPPVEERRAIARKALLPSAEHIEAIRNTARGVADDTLRHALERLGATLKRIYEDSARP